MTDKNKIAFINGKGGCGKTTSIFHIAGVLSKLKEPVLVIDLDKQRNTTDSLLLNNNEDDRTYTMYNLLCGECTPDQIVKKSYIVTRPNAKPEYCGIDVLPSDIRLKDEKDYQDADIKEILDNFIGKNGYKWVLVDMPPSNETINKICFQQIVDFVVVPFTSDGYSVSGYGDLIESINEARGKNPDLYLIGGYLARYDNSSFDQFIKDQLMGAFDNLFIDIQIPMTLEIRESVAFGRPINYYKNRFLNKWAAESTLRNMQERGEICEIIKSKVDKNGKTKFFIKTVNPSIYAYERLINEIETRINERK